jgi:hypothetical protein
MRQNLIVALLAVCCTLLAVNLYVALRGPQLPFAYGQSVGVPSGSVVLATGVSQGGSEAVLYLYDAPSQSLACYTVKGQGIELRGVRRVTYDLKAVEFPAKGGKAPSVKDMKGAVEKGGDEK